MRNELTKGRIRPKVLPVPPLWHATKDAQRDAARAPEEPVNRSLQLMSLGLLLAKFLFR